MISSLKVEEHEMVMNDIKRYFPKVMRDKWQLILNENLSCIMYYNNNNQL